MSDQLFLCVCVHMHVVCVVLCVRTHMHVVCVRTHAHAHVCPHKKYHGAS
jgi:hypothetical protein